MKLRYLSADLAVTGALLRGVLVANLSDPDDIGIASQRKKQPVMLRDHDRVPRSSLRAELPPEVRERTVNRWREVDALEHELSSLRSPRPAPTVARKKKGGPASPRGQAASKGSAASASAEPSPRGQFSGAALKAHRERVGLSADNYARLLGVSGLSIYNWEQGKARPRKSSADAWTAIRRIGKREAAKRLAALETPEAKSESKQTRAEK